MLLLQGGAEPWVEQEEEEEVGMGNDVQVACRDERRTWTWVRLHGDQEDPGLRFCCMGGRRTLG